MLNVIICLLPCVSILVQLYSDNIHEMCATIFTSAIYEIFKAIIHGMHTVNHRYRNIHTSTTNV